MTHAHINLVQPDDAPDDLQPIFERADAAMTGEAIPCPTLFGNQVRALAHNPALLTALLDVYKAFAETQSVDRKLLELGVLVVSRVNACDYCLKHHTPLGHESGLNEAQLRAIHDMAWTEQRDLWSDVEWLVVQYAEQMTREPYKISAAFFADFKQHFTDRQITDMTMRFALCSAWNKFNDALGLDTETAFQHAYAEVMGNEAT